MYLDEMYRDQIYRDEQSRLAEGWSENKQKGWGCLDKLNRTVFKLVYI